MVNPTRCFVIAEAGVNHNGSAERAVELVVAAAKAGADAVKFQTFNAEDLVTECAPRAAYQVDRLGQGDQLSMLRALELPASAYPRLIDKCAELGIEFMSTPFDEASARMLVGLGMRRLKVGSGELTNLPLLRGLASLGLPMIVSTGMADLAEVREAVEAVTQAWARSGVRRTDHMLTLLHCTSNYPAAPADVNLRAMRTLHAEFDLPAGYSDHTVGIEVAIGAAALGATVIEKHFTLDRTLPGPDHKASLEPDELAQMVRAIRTVELALGSAQKTPAPSELAVRDVVRRSVTTTRNMAAGELIAAQDLALRRPGTGIPPRHIERVAGRRAARSLPAGTVLQWRDLEP